EPSTQTWNCVTDPSGSFSRAAVICGSVLRNAHGCVNSPQKWIAPERRTTRRTSDKTSMGGPKAMRIAGPFQKDVCSVNPRAFRQSIGEPWSLPADRLVLQRSVCAGPRVFLDEEYQLPGSVKEMLAAANAAVPKVSFEEAAALVGRDNVLVVDVRDLPE